MDASGGCEHQGGAPEECLDESVLDEVDRLYGEGEAADWYRRCRLFLLRALEAVVAEMNTENRACFETAQALQSGRIVPSAEIDLCKEVLVRVQRQRGRDPRQAHLAGAIWPGLFVECGEWEYPSYVLAEFDCDLCEIGVPCVVTRAALRAAFPGVAVCG